MQNNLEHSFTDSSTLHTPNFDPEKAGWTIHQTERAVCIDVKHVTVSTPGGKKPTIILTLKCLETENTIIKFFNCEKTEKGNLKVNKNSDFARTYRLTLGADPQPRYSRAQSLLNHLVGFEFSCYYTLQTDTQGNLYYKAKAKDFHVAKPVYSDRWFSDGVLMPLRNKQPVKSEYNPIQPQSFGSKQKTRASQTTGNAHAKNDQKTGKKVSMAPLAKASNGNGLRGVLGSLPHTPSQGSRVDSLPHALPDHKKSNDSTHVALHHKDQRFEHHRQPGESFDEFMDRAIDYSMADW